ncbi:MAG: hypothetical protein ACREBW_01610, partial [Candidatus Micrarchaeaceae archaeon]
IKLGSEQRLRIDCKAVLGEGNKHAKFQPGLVSYDQSGDNAFTFTVEAFGQMSPKEIINKALTRIKEEVKDIQKSAKKL